MPDLLRKPFGTHGKVHDITPENAGWRYVGFSLYRLRAGENASLGGVLAQAGVERVEKVGVMMRVWRFRPEPARGSVN